jgi:hypothetical protein
MYWVRLLLYIISVLKIYVNPWNAKKNQSRTYANPTVTDTDIKAKTIFKRHLVCFVHYVWFCIIEFSNGESTILLDGQCYNSPMQNAILCVLRQFNDNELTTKALNKTLRVANVAITAFL